MRVTFQHIEDWLPSIDRSPFKMAGIVQMAKVSDRVSKFAY